MKKLRILVVFPLIFVGWLGLAQEPNATDTPATGPSPTETHPPAAVTALSAPQPIASPSVESSPPPRSFEEAYKEGVQFYQAKAYDKARDAFTQAVAKDPHNASALTNLALAQYKLNQKGWAIGLLRKALEVDPHQATAQAGLKFALSQLEVREIPHQIETYETLREDFLQPVTMTFYLGLTALLFFAVGWTFINYAGKRKKALREEDALPAFPLIPSLFALAFAVSVTLTALKIYDLSLTRGTILDDKVTVQAAPGDNQVTLFDLHAGFEVIVRQVDKDWVQVTYPGAATGWIKKSSLLVTSGS
jgi:hypothetical protein